MSETLKIGLVSISDRASTGVYEDKGIPALQDWLGRALASPWECVTRLIADEQALFNADRTAYLHVAPAIARFTFAPAADEVLLQVTLDGRFLGLAPEAIVVAALQGGG